MVNSSQGLAATASTLRVALVDVQTQEILNGYLGKHFYLCNQYKARPINRNKDASRNNRDLLIQRDFTDQDLLAGLKPGPGETGVPPLQKLEAKTSLS